MARLLLSPASARGWFGGRALLAQACLEVRAGLSVSEAARALEDEFRSGDGVTAVLARYDGACTLARFGPAERGPLAPAGPVIEPWAGGSEAAAPLLRDVGWDLAPAEFRRAVVRICESIADGAVYVVNLTARLEGMLVAASPGAAFGALQRRACADMAALFEGLPGPTPWIASVSPERFVRIRRAASHEDAPLVVATQPIKGTRPRGADPEHDARLRAELLSDSKELAEHVMVVDLERNDLGRACVPGSVTVEPLYEVVTTPYCHQLVSTVTGVLRPDAPFAELLESMFPCGSVTGAPKRATMDAIAALEASERGAYCGALLVALRGELDSSVLIRTLEGVEGAPGRARYGTGCGITADSDPAREHLEALLKASLVTGDSAPPVALRETMRVVGGRAPLLELHLARLARGGTGPAVLARVRAAVARELARPEAHGGQARLGVTVTPDGSVAAGLSFEPSTLSVEGGPVLVPIEVPEPPVLPAGAAKPASRRIWDRAHRAARMRGGHQAALVTPDGLLVDGSTATLWLVVDGALHTPPAPPAVAGVCREMVRDAAADLGVAVVERTLTRADLDAAEEVWLSNAHGGMVAVRHRGGPVGARVARRVQAAMNGEPAARPQV